MPHNHFCEQRRADEKVTAELHTFTTEHFSEFVERKSAMERVTKSFLEGGVVGGLVLFAFPTANWLVKIMRERVFKSVPMAAVPIPD